jgi:D-arabinose 1-dehydrogenase-like Zn-dependent alcohol dehydrogenase
MTTTTVAVATMKSAQVPRPGAKFQIAEREILEPAPGQVRIKVQACGVCHSDVFTKEGWWSGIQYPRAPGHEVVGYASGTPADTEDTLRFAELTGVRPMIETYSLDQAEQAYARMMSGKAQFRVVLTM